MIFQSLNYLTLLDELYTQQIKDPNHPIYLTFVMSIDFISLASQFDTLCYFFHTPTATYTQPINLNSTVSTAIVEYSTLTLENTQQIYQYSIPIVKLFYPEPYIAAPSFMHSDLWFVHILVYQYWLWFIFIFIIVFFLIVFICIVRWCNMRTKPRRETRGVSRSKCGDLITAIVPVSWAASIIISESTDAIDYFDGFGTTEMVVGIRAYQWGWEYYYPKDIDLNYNVKSNYSSFFGRSLKYNKTSAGSLHSNKMWKFYQNKMYDFVVTPAHLLLLPTDNTKLLNYLNFSDVGTNVFHESSLFKHTRMFSKTNPAPLLYTASGFDWTFKSLTPLFISDLNLQDSSLYGLKRQTNLTNAKAVTNNFTTLFNLTSVNKFFKFNYKFWGASEKTFTGKLSINFFHPVITSPSTQNQLPLHIHTSLNSDSVNLFFIKKLYFSNLFEKLNNNSDKKKLKSSLSRLVSLFNGKTQLQHALSLQPFTTFNNSLSSPLSLTEQTFSNLSHTYKFFASFSANEILQKPNQTPKLITNIKTRHSNFNLSSSLNAASQVLNLTQQRLTPLHNEIRSITKLKSATPTVLYKLLTTRLTYDAPTGPFLSNQTPFSLLNFDRYLPAENETTFVNYQSREDLSPDHIYKTYWNIYAGQTDLTWRLQHAQNFLHLHNSFYLPFFTFGQDYDFLNWQGFTYLEDSYWENLSSIYALDDYLTFFDLMCDESKLNKIDRRFSRKNRIFSPDRYVVLKPYWQDSRINSFFYSNFVYSEDNLPNPTLLSLWQFSLFPAASNILLIEETFDYSKAITQNYSIFLSTKFNYATLQFAVNNLTFVMDNFRTNVEDFNWIYDNETPLNINNLKFIKELNTTILNLPWQVETFITSIQANFAKINLKSSLDCCPINLVWVDNFFDFQQTSRFASKFDLRTPTKNTLVTYNSYQKVYKPRFDENRSHAKTMDLAGLASKQPNLTAPKAKLERSLGKNTNYFFQTTLFKKWATFEFKRLILYSYWIKLLFFRLSIFAWFKKWPV